MTGAAGAALVGDGACVERVIDDGRRDRVVFGRVVRCRRGCAAVNDAVGGDEDAAPGGVGLESAPHPAPARTTATAHSRLTTRRALTP